MSDKTASGGTFKSAGEDMEQHYSDEDVVKVTDRGGEALEFLVTDDGLHIPVMCKPRLIKKIKDFKMRADDVLILGYPRSGTHWASEMTSMLLNGKAETIDKFKDHIEIEEPEKLENTPSPRVINTHIKLYKFPDDVRRKVKVIYTLRDPKDVAVSHYRIFYGVPFPRLVYNGSFGDFLPLFLAETACFGNTFEHIRENEKFIEENPDAQVYIQKYEDAKQDPVLSVQKLSDFLGVPRNDDLCRAIADKCNFSKMKVDKEKYAITLNGDNFVYRKGVVGDWRNYFTEELLDDFYRVYDEKMAGSRFYDLYARDKC